MPDLWHLVDLADTCTLFHGMPTSAMHCLLYHRVLFQSNTADDRERTPRGTSGVYCFMNRLQPQLLWYAKWNCLTDKDIAYAAFVQFTGTAQAATSVKGYELALPSYAARPMAILVQQKRLSEVPLGDFLVRNWSPEAEVHPIGDQALFRLNREVTAGWAAWESVEQVEAVAPAHLQLSLAANAAAPAASRQCSSAKQCCAKCAWGTSASTGKLPS